MTTTPETTKDTNGRYAVPGFLIVCAILLAARFLHFGPVIDGPHPWRQADTAMYAYGFYKYEFNIFYPSVCWRGAYRLCALEFPIHEFAAAVLYKAFGPHLALTRAVTLAFFIGSAYYLYRILALVAGTAIAAMATVLYCAFPLGFVYSRAIHIDTSALCFAHATLYYLLRAADRPGIRYPLLATVAGVCAWTVKAPYVACLYIPLAVYAFCWPPDARKLLRLLVPTLVAVAAFVAWRVHSNRINAGVPDWPYVDKMVGLDWWYYGTLGQRLQGPGWLRIGERLRDQVFSVPGLVLLVIGLPLLGLSRSTRLFCWSWAVGVVAYCVVFFNLNTIHDYYQLPFLAISALFVAVGLEWLRRRVAAIWPVLKRRCGVARTVAVSVMAAFLIWQGERVLWYGVQEWVEQVGSILQEHTPETALVITAPKGLTSANAPTILYAARRLGWSLAPERILQADVLDAYRKAGAAYLALIGDAPVPEPLRKTLGLSEPVVFPLDARNAVQLFSLESDRS